MKKIVALSLLTGCLSLGAFADDLTGYVSDAHCGVKHDSVSDANSKCIAGCLKGGSAPVLVSNGKVMQFDKASQEKVAAFAGQNVKIDGSVSGDSITVNSVEAAK